MYKSKCCYESIQILRVLKVVVDGGVCCHQPFIMDMDNIERRRDITVWSRYDREILDSQRNRLVACTRLWRRVTSRVLSPCYQGVLLFVLHFNSTPVRSLQRGHAKERVSPYIFFSPLSLFVFCLFCSLCLSYFPSPRRLSSFLFSVNLSHSYRRWSSRTRGDTSFP